jgi:septum formation protein
VILASASPRRRELLTLIGMPHEVRPANVDEGFVAGETPPQHAERLARDKAAAIEADDAVIIGSDTIVVIDCNILNKPADRTEAAAMLRTLSGRSHTVMTGIAVRWRGQTRSAVEQVGVTFRALRHEDIERYIDTGEPMDKAGAYGIQGYGATIVTRVDGDYFAVMGLPVHRMVVLMKELGLRYDFGPLAE